MGSRSAGGEAPDPAVVTVLDLERALAELPEDFRSVLLLADLEGLAAARDRADHGHPHRNGEIAALPGAPDGAAPAGRLPDAMSHGLPRDPRVLEEHRRRELRARRARAVEAHLAGCPACRGMLGAGGAHGAARPALPRSPAPPALVRQVRALGARPRGIAGWLGRPWVAAASPRSSSRRCSRPGSPAPGGPATSWTPDPVGGRRAPADPARARGPAPGVSADPDALFHRVRSVDRRRAPQGLRRAPMSSAS